MYSKKEIENGYDQDGNIIWDIESLFEPSTQFELELENLLSAYQKVDEWSKNRTPINILMFKLWFKNEYASIATLKSNEIFRYIWDDDFLNIIFDITKLQIKYEYESIFKCSIGAVENTIYEFLAGVANEPFLNHNNYAKSKLRIFKNSDFSYLDFIKGYDPMEEVILYLENQYEPTFLEY